MTDKNSEGLFYEDGLNFVQLIGVFWSKKWLVVKFVAVFFLLGLFIAIFSQNYYESKTLLVPQVTNGSNVGGNLKGLAAFAGINLGSLDDGADISPILYPKIFESLSFQKELLQTNLSIKNQEGSVTFEKYYDEIYDPGFLATVKKYTIGLPGVIVGGLKGDTKAEDFKPQTSSVADTLYIDIDTLPTLSKKERKLTRILSRQLKIIVNEDEGYISIVAEMPEKIASAQLASNAKRVLQNKIIQIQVNKAQTHLSYLENRLEEKKREYFVSQSRLASFKDKNLFTSTEIKRMQLEKLEGENDLAFGVYSQLAQQVESQKLQVKRDTPVFTVIQPPTVPYDKAGPNKPFILIGYILVGFIFSLIYIFLREYLKFVKSSGAFGK